MARTIQVTVQGDLGVLLVRARSAASEQGATFEGTQSRGTFSGQGLSGHYVVVNEIITITILEKPWWAPWSAVESQLRSFFDE
jgi:hypothetical protein